MGQGSVLPCGVLGAEPLTISGRAKRALKGIAKGDDPLPGVWGQGPLRILRFDLEPVGALPLQPRKGSRPLDPTLCKQSYRARCLVGHRTGLRDGLREDDHHPHAPQRGRCSDAPKSGAVGQGSVLPCGVLGAEPLTISGRAKRALKGIAKGDDLLPEGWRQGLLRILGFDLEPVGAEPLTISGRAERAAPSQNISRRGSTPLTPRFASKAKGLAASLGIRLIGSNEKISKASLIRPPLCSGNDLAARRVWPPRDASSQRHPRQAGSIHARGRS